MLVSRNVIYDFIRKFDCGVMLVCMFNRPRNFVSSQSETTSFNFRLDTCKVLACLFCNTTSVFF